MLEAGRLVPERPHFLVPHLEDQVEAGGLLAQGHLSEIEDHVKAGGLLVQGHLPEIEDHVKAGGLLAQNHLPEIEDQVKAGGLLAQGYLPEIFVFVYTVRYYYRMTGPLGAVLWICGILVWIRILLFSFLTFKTPTKNGSESRRLKNIKILVLRIRIHNTG